MNYKKLGSLYCMVCSVSTVLAMDSQEWDDKGKGREDLREVVVETGPPEIFIQEEPEDRGRRRHRHSRNQRPESRQDRGYSLALDNIERNNTQDEKTEEQEDSDLDTNRLLLTALLDAQGDDGFYKRETHKRHILKDAAPHMGEMLRSLSEHDEQASAKVRTLRRDLQSGRETPHTVRSRVDRGSVLMSPEALDRMLLQAIYDERAAERKEALELAGEVATDAPVDLSMLYNCVASRSRSVKGKTAIRRHTQEAAPHIEKWLELMKQEDPLAHKQLMSAFNEAQSGESSQRNAVPKLIDAVDELDNVDMLHAMMNQIMLQSERDEKRLAEERREKIEGKQSIYQKALAGMATLTGLLAVVTPFIAIYAGSDVPLSLDQCLQVFNATDLAKCQALIDLVTIANA